MKLTTYVPREIRAPRGAFELEIDWSDGHKSVYPHSRLRGYCPCANCQGHQGPIRFVAAGNLELQVIEEVGNYALQLTWGDGHSTGIYSYTYLRNLCGCEMCGPPQPTRT